MADNAEATKSEKLSITFEPELMARFWQHNAMRMMRVNERIMHGLMHAASREMELAQELLRYNLGRLDKFSHAAEQARPGLERSSLPDGTEQLKEFEHIVSGMREISQDLWKTFSDASKLMLEGGLTEAREVADSTTEPMKKAGQQAVAMASQVADSARE